MRQVKLILILLVTGLLVVAACSPKVSSPAIDKLANCLADKGVKEYGAFWCPNCAKQEKKFGTSMSILKDRNVYVECDPRCDVPRDELPKACRGMVGQPELCLEKGVDKYPHWEFLNGEILIGNQELSVLAEKSGCEYAEV